MKMKELVHSAQCLVLSAKKVLAVAMPAIVFAITAFGTPQEGVREYEYEYPDEAEQEVLQDSDQWRGTAWLKCIDRNEDWQGTKLDHYGNTIIPDHPDDVTVASGDSGEVVKREMKYAFHFDGSADNDPAATAAWASSARPSADRPVFVNLNKAAVIRLRPLFML